jgi:hypothetical protein
MHPAHVRRHRSLLTSMVVPQSLGLHVLVGLVAILTLAGCQTPPTEQAALPEPSQPSPSPPPRAPTVAPAVAEPPPSAGLAPSPSPPPSPARPAWLGTRVLPLRPDGLGEIQPTPPELQDRRLPSIDLLPPPPDGSFRVDIRPVPSDVAARSTWSPACPVALEDLRYVTLTFWGFDDRPHTGELLVNAAVAEDVAGVFARLYKARFPIEEMRVVAREELDAPPTGDGNNTSAFVCRPTTLGSSWSQHAYGLAVDVNPFHNPYARGDVVLPELASAYVDRNRQLPGMVALGGPVTEAFAAIGWEWGGRWNSMKDWMHFSRGGN